MNTMVGIVALVVGVVLLGFAYQSSNAPLEQIFSTFTGRYTDQTTELFYPRPASS